MTAPRSHTVPASVTTGTFVTAGQLDWVERDTTFWDLPAEEWSDAGPSYSTDPAATAVAGGES